MVSVVLKIRPNFHLSRFTFNFNNFIRENLTWFKVEFSNKIPSFIWESNEFHQLKFPTVNDTRRQKPIKFSVIAFVQFFCGCQKNFNVFHPVSLASTFLLKRIEQESLKQASSYMNDERPSWAASKFSKWKCVKVNGHLRSDFLFSNRCSPDVIHVHYYRVVWKCFFL